MNTLNQTLAEISRKNGITIPREHSPAWRVWLRQCQRYVADGTTGTTYSRDMKRAARGERPRRDNRDNRDN